jgi:hypothetical protein
VRAELARKKWFWAIVIAIGSPVALAGPALGAGSPQEIAEAEVLFQEGKRLMAAGNYGQACPKLAESQRLDPGGGTLVTLALCHESEGRTASAWAEFSEALTLALKDGRVDRATVAREHGERLEPKLSRLTVRVPPRVSGLDGVEILQDGHVLGRAAWGTPLPVDPGEHLIEARAPGKKTWSRVILIAPAADRQATEVALEDEPAQKVALPASADAKAPRAEPSHAQRTAGFVVGGVGLGLVGAASYFGFRALSDRSTAKDKCPTSPCSDRDAVNLNESSKREADLSTAGFALGGVALAVATILVLTSPSSKPASAYDRRLRVAPLLGARELGAVVSTGW